MTRAVAQIRHIENNGDDGLYQEHVSKISEETLQESVVRVFIFEPAVHDELNRVNLM